MKKALYCLLLLLFLSAGLFSIDDIQLHLKVISMEQAEPPQFYFDQILFTVSPEDYTRHVGIAFAHENFQRIHSFQKNDKGLYFLLMDIPSETFLDYRLIVDGIWQNDPQSIENVEGINGISFSRLPIPERLRSETQSPMVISENRVEFLLYEEPGTMVYLSGDFNHWDPYMISMKEIEPGLFQAIIPLSRGNHFYNFIVNGEPRLDPQNRNTHINSYGEEVSSIFLP